MAKKGIVICMDENILKKLCVIAKFEDHTINQQINWLIHNNIRIYEETFGEIKIAEHPDISNHKN